MRLWWLVCFSLSLLLLNVESLKFRTLTLVKCDCNLYDKNGNVRVFRSYDRVVVVAKRAEFLIDMGEQHEIESVHIWGLLEPFNLLASVGFQQYKADQSYNCSDRSCRENCHRSTYARYIYLILNSSRTQTIDLSRIRIGGLKPTENTKDLAFGRPYFPVKCELNAGAINHRPRNYEDTSKLREEPFEVALDGVYAIRNISLITKSKEKFDITLIQTNDERIKFVIKITDCQYSISYQPIICQIPENKSLLLNTVAVEVKASHLSKLEVYGDPFYYPTIRSHKVLFDDKINLVFIEQPCDPIFMNCFRFYRMYQCDEMRISHTDDNSTTMISRGESVLPRWRSQTEFTLKKEKGRFILTVPRSYQYIGSYFAECIINDNSQTKLFSSSIRIFSSDVKNGLLLNVSIEVGEKEEDISKPTLFESVKNNIIVLTKKARYLLIKVKLVSIHNDVSIKEMYKEYRKSSNLKRFLQSSTIKAFISVNDSWNIDVYVYQWMFIFDVVQQSIPFTWLAQRGYITGSTRLEVIDMTNSTWRNQLFVWKWLRSEESVEFRVYTASNDTYRVSLIEETCGDGVNDRKMLTISKDACSSDCMKMRIGQSAVIKLTNASPTSLFTLVGHDNSNNRIVIRKMSNRYLLRDIQQNLKKVKFTYSILSLDSVQREINIQIDISGKGVVEFIKCANLTVKISQRGKPEIWGFLKTDYILMKVKPVKNETVIDIVVQMKFEFLGINGKSGEQTLILYNPFEFGIYGYKRSGLEENQLQPTWVLSFNELTKILIGYRVNILGIVQACQSINMNETYILNKQNVSYDNKVVFPVSLPISNQKIMNYTLTIQSLFKEENNGVYFGKSFIDQFQTGSQKKGSLSIIGDRRNTSQLIMLTAGQLDLSCTFESAQFNITMVEGLQFNPTFTRINESLYEIGGLIPGKLYDIQATVHYQLGSDLPTDRIRFETVDEILVLKNVVDMLVKMESDINQLKQDQQTILKSLQSRNQILK